MTATALKVKSTPIGPYIDLLESMTREEKQIVVTFITETMKEPAKKAKTEAGWADRFAGAWKDSRSTEEIIRDSIVAVCVIPE